MNGIETFEDELEKLEDVHKYSISDVLDDDKPECEHDLIPTDIRPHTKEPKRMILILVCRKCYGHQYKTSKRLE